MKEWIYWILNMSIMGSLVSIIVLLLRKVKQIPRRFLYVLWCVPFLRFMLPVAISTKISVFNLLEKWSMKTIPVKPLLRNQWSSQLPIHQQMDELSSTFTFSNFIQGAKTYQPVTYKTDVLQGIFHVTFLVWLCVMLCLFGVILISYCYTSRRILRTVTENSQGDVKYNLSAEVTSPCVYGILHPIIVLPADKEYAHLEPILLHEQVHAKRHDNVFRFLALFTACVHWFNPFAWYLLKCFFEDMEFSCDEKVLQTLNKEQQTAYAQAILDHASKKSLYVSTFGGAPAKLRIKRILAYRKLSCLALCSLIVFLIAISMILLTNASH